MRKRNLKKIILKMTSGKHQNSKQILTWIISQLYKQNQLLLQFQINRKIQCLKCNRWHKRQSRNLKQKSFKRTMRIMMRTISTRTKKSILRYLNMCVLVIENSSWFCQAVERLEEPEWKAQRNSWQNGIWGENLKGKLEGPATRKQGRVRRRRIWPWLSIN